MPKRELAEIGIDIDDESTFAKVMTMENHDSAIRAVLEEKVDVAAVSSVNLESMVVNGSVKSSDFRIIHQSSDILCPAGLRK